MKFGVGLGAELRFDEIAEHARVADECGFSHVTFVDQSNVSREVHGMMTLAALSTSRVHIGQGLSDPSMYHPAVIANFVASLREFTGGRAFAGIGAGSPRAGRAMEKSVGLQALREAVTFIKEFTAGRDAELWGHTWHSEWIRNTRWVGQPVRVFMGPIGPKSLQLAGEIADDIWVFGAGEPEFMKWNVEMIRKGASKAKRDPSEVRVWARTEVYLHESKELGRRATASYAASCAGGVYSSIFRRDSPESQDLAHRLEKKSPGIVDELKRITEGFDPYKHEAGDAPHSRLATDRVIDFFNLTGSSEDIIEMVQHLENIGPMVFPVFNMLYQTKRRT